MATDRSSGHGTQAAEAASGWFVSRNGTQWGPTSLEDIRVRFAGGEVAADDLLWNPTRQSWAPAGEVLSQVPAGARSKPKHASNAAGSRPRSNLRRRSAIAYSLLILLLVTLSLASCFQFLAEGEAKVSSFAVAGTDRQNALILSMQIVETNLAREQMRLHVVPRLSGALSRGSPRLPARDIELTLASVAGPRVMNLKQDHHAEPFDLDIALSDGDILLYPMDSYQGWVEAEALFAGTSEKVPVVIDLSPRNHAVHVVPSLGRESEAGDVVVQLAINRLLPIVAFIWFMSGVAGFLSITVVLVVISVIRGTRAPELGMLGWMTALLFALPAVRNSLPGAPPLGGLIDYSAFFWAEALVGLSMMVLVGLWYFHREQQQA